MKFFALGLIIFGCSIFGANALRAETTIITSEKPNNRTIIIPRSSPDQKSPKTENNTRFNGEGQVKGKSGKDMNNGKRAVYDANGNIIGWTSK